jgi:DNA-binding transcriptional LysR family regulator
MDHSHQLQTALPQLSTFLAVARHRSFSGAARELRVSTSAVSQSVRQLEEMLRVVLLHRTTRAVTPTEAGKRLIERASGPVKLALESLAAANAKAGDVTGHLKLSVSQGAEPHVLDPVVPVFRQRHPQVSLEVVIEKRAGVDFVAEGFDAAFRVTEMIERDMVRLRLTDPFRFLVVGSPAYFAKHGRPGKPEDLLQHECITFRWPVPGALYAWELERGRRKWRVPVRGGLITNSVQFCLTMAEAGVGLAYLADLSMREALAHGRLVAVLEDYAPTEQGIFLCHPSRAQQSPALRQFVSVAKEVLRRR